MTWPTASTIPLRPVAPFSRPSRLGQVALRVWTILRLAVRRFFQIDGAHWAGAFAFNAFFSLFPLMVLLVTIASSFVDRERAGKEVIAYMESYVPIGGEMQRHIFDTIAGVIQAREQAGAVALLLWIYLSGCVFIFGACLCAGRAEALRQPAETTTAAILGGVNTP